MKETDKQSLLRQLANRTAQSLHSFKLILTLKSKNSDVLKSLT